MEKAKDKFKIGQLVVILVNNSHHGDIGKIVGFDDYNEYNVKVAFEGNEVQAAFETDMLSAAKEIIISSPGLNQQKVHWLINLLPDLYYRNVSITVLTSRKSILT